MAPSTRVFVSATSGDLRTVRRMVKEALLSMECHPVEQTNFPPDYRTVREMLNDKIKGCSAVIHIVGNRYGAEPDPALLPEGTLRRSYTQMEYDLARQLNKKVYVFLCPDHFPFDQCEHESIEKQQLQRAYRDQLNAAEQIRTEVADSDQLAVKVRELQVKLQELHQEVQRGKMAVAGGVAVLILVMGGLGYGIARLTGSVGSGNAQIDQAKQQIAAVQQTSEKIALSVMEVPQKTIAELQNVYDNPEKLAERMRANVRQKAEEELQAARDRKTMWEEIRELERSRDVALEKVDEVIQTIQQGLAGQPDAVFAEASRILADEGVDASLGYLSSHQQEILARVDRLEAREAEARQQKHQALQPLLLQADLQKTNLNWDAARKLFEIVAEKAPQWSRAHRELGRLLDDIAEFDAAEPHLTAALSLAESDDERVSASNELGILYLHQARYAEAEPLLQQVLQLSEKRHGPEHSEVAAALNNLAQLLKATNRLAEAEPLMRRVVDIFEKSLGADQPNVATCLNNLALLLKATNRLAEAEPLMRRALAIDEQSYGDQHPKVAIRLNNLAQFLQATNRLAEAEPLIRRALAIDEQSYGDQHPNVARDLNNLAQLLQATNRLAEAEPLLRRALAIDEQSYGDQHPNVASDLNNLAQLLQATNHLAEAEPLMRRALAIDKQSYGDQHPEVARDLNNLAQLLQATNRLAEAEPLMRRALAIDEQSYGTEHTDVARDLSNLAALLRATNRLAEAEPLARRALEIFQQSLGNQHTNTVTVRNNHAAIVLELEGR